MNILFQSFLLTVVGSSGVEPPTSCLSGMRSNLLSYEPVLFAHFRNSPLIIGFIPLELHIRFFQPMVEMKGFEPLTPCLQGRCSPNWATPPNGIPTVPENRTTTSLSNFVLRRLFVSLRVTSDLISISHVLHRKEVIQPHLPIRLPCYDLTPITEPTFGSCPRAVSSLTSGVSDFHGLTGGVYKARERIHRGMLIRDY